MFFSYKNEMLELFLRELTNKTIQKLNEANSDIVVAFRALYDLKAIDASKDNWSDNQFSSDKRNLLLLESHSGLIIANLTQVKQGKQRIHITLWSNNHKKHHFLIQTIKSALSEMHCDVLINSDLTEDGNQIDLRLNDKAISKKTTYKQLQRAASLKEKLNQVPNIAKDWLTNTYFIFNEEKYWGVMLPLSIPIIIFTGINFAKAWFIPFVCHFVAVSIYTFIRKDYRRWR
ncbi:MAG: hypothetical protein ACRCXZ_01325 [Patescibacteria group bacterium]